MKWLDNFLNVKQKMYKMFSKLYKKEDFYFDEEEFMKAYDHKPPLLEFPNYKKDSMGWRMGYGESYKMLYEKWLNSLSEDRRNKHIEYYKKYENFMERK